MSKLVLEDLEKRYGDAAVVQKMNLTLTEGEFVSLLGPSGCGKTTTLRMIAGFVDPSAGSISMNGEVLSRVGMNVPPERRGMSMIFQSYAIWPNMTVRENVGFGLTVRRLPAAEVRQRVDQILDVVKLGHLAARYPAELSGGQQQRVALARAIVVRPQVLLLDEPLSNLDANLREEMRNEIRRLHDEFGMTTVYVTHDQSEAMAISDRIAVMNGGNLEQIDTPWALYNRPRTRFVAEFIGRTNLVHGVLRDTGIVCPGFVIDPASVELAGRSPGAEVAVSIRPQALQLHAEQSGGSTPVQIRSRTYLGEYWDYVVSPAENATCELRVSASPGAVFESGTLAWMSFKREGIAVLP